MLTLPVRSSPGNACEMLVSMAGRGAGPEEQGAISWLLREPPTPLCINSHTPKSFAPRNREFVLTKEKARETQISVAYLGIGKEVGSVRHSSCQAEAGRGWARKSAPQTRNETGTLRMGSATAERFWTRGKRDGWALPRAAGLGAAVGWRQSCCGFTQLSGLSGGSSAQAPAAAFVPHGLSKRWEGGGSPLKDGMAGKAAPAPGCALPC